MYVCRMYAEYAGESSQPFGRVPELNSRGPTTLMNYELCLVTISQILPEWYIEAYKTGERLHACLLATR